MATTSTPYAKRAKALPPGMVQRGRKYHADFMKDGRRIRKPLSSDLKAAKEMLNELRSRADKGALQLLDNRYPWAELRKAFLAWAKQNVADWRQYQRALDTFEKFLPITNVNQVTAQVIDQFRNWRLSQGVCPRTVNREVGTIGNMLNQGADRFEVIAANPIAAVEALAHPKPVKVRRSLSLEEVEMVFEHTPADLLPVFRLYATTGMRKSEVVTLRFSDIDWERKTLTVRAEAAKDKESREVPLEDLSLELLRGLHEAADSRPEGWSRDVVFLTCRGNPLRNNLLRRFYVVCKNAGIADAKPGGKVDLHALRGTFATLAMDGGANPKAVQAILGHSTLGMTMKAYAKATDRAKRAAINALSFASVTSPEHVVTMNRKAAELSQNSHKSENGQLSHAG
jgi:integrase